MRAGGRGAVASCTLVVDVDAEAPNGPPVCHAAALVPFGSFPRLLEFSGAAHPIGPVPCISAPPE